MRLAVWTIALTASASIAIAQDDYEPEVWLCAGDRIQALADDDAEWTYVKEHLAGIKLYVGQLVNTEPEQLEQLVKMVEECDLQVAVEIGCCLGFGPMDDTNGEWSATAELAAIDNWYELGGTVDFLDLDGPVRRLMHPDNRKDDLAYTSMEDAAREVVDAVRIFHEAHPEIGFWHLTNFPNWGYMGDVSYHARGPESQDYGEYDDAHRIVAEALIEAGIPLEGVTIDNPYDYLIGRHFSVKLEDPTSVDWLARVRAYEDRSRDESLKVNLIINSQKGGQESDELFCEETLKMVDLYMNADGRPDRWFVQSWYEYPKEMLPETAEFSMTALVKAVIERVNQP